MPTACLRSFNPSAFSFSDEAANDLFDHGRPFIDQAGVNLQEACPGGDFFPSVFGSEDAADAHDGEPAFGLPVEVANDFGAALAQGTTAQTARFGVDFLEPGILRLRPGDGGVGGDQAGNFAGANELENFVQSFKGEVGGDFDEDGFAGRSVESELFGLPGWRRGFGPGRLCPAVGGDWACWANLH